MSKLYGIGVGPGDPALLIIKAVSILEEVDVVAVPAGGGDKTAINIVGKYIGNKEIIYCNTPMIRDEILLQKNYQENADLICSYLKVGKNVGFFTLGDPSIYSTYSYIHEIVKKRGYSVELIPGIPSFCAGAASLNTVLCEKDEILHIIPASYEGLVETLSCKGTKVLMKNGRKIDKIKVVLKELGIYHKAQLVSCSTMENEKIYRNLDEVENGESYFSIILIKEERNFYFPGTLVKDDLVLGMISAKGNNHKLVKEQLVLVVGNEKNNNR